MQKKGQVTFFIIIALAVLFIIIFVLMFAAKAKDKALQDQAKDITDQIFSKTSIENYISSCLNTVSYEGIELLRLQGGKFFSNQANYSQFNYSYVNYTDKKRNEEYMVTYGIIQEFDDVAPTYPCPQDPYMDDSCGVSNMDFTASNFVDFYNRSSCAYDVNNFNSSKRSCNFGSLYLNRATLGTSSLQVILKEYIEQNFLKCIDLSVLNLTYGFEIKSEKPDVTVKMGDDDVNIDLSFPISVDISGKSVHSYSDYKTVIPSRIKTLYDKVIFGRNSPFVLETKNASYDFAKKINRYFLSRNIGFDFHIQKSVGVTSDDIIIIEDIENRNLGYPDLYLFAIKNRHPAMSLINNSENYLYDIRASTTETLILEPIVHDPDDDKLFFKYSGWKADYDCIYDLATDSCNIEYNPSDLDLPHFRNRDDDAKIYNVSDGSAMLELDDDDENCLLAFAGDCPRAFIDEDGDGTKDKYLFNVTLNVTDGELFDFQELLISTERIVIPARPDIKQIYGYILNDEAKQFAIDNGFSDIVISVEDPYKLIQRSSSIFTGILRWSFGEPSRLDYDTSKLCTIMPSMGECDVEQDFVDLSNVDIETIKNDVDGMLKYFNNPSLTSDKRYFDKISLETNPGTIISDSSLPDESVTVVECIPHRSSQNTWLLGSAFNDLDKDPYLSNHSCCYDNYSYRDDSTVCFDDSFYQCGSLDVPYDEQNDILSIVIQKKCSGDRGNICSGVEVSETISYNDCGDKTRETDIARCSACTTYIDEYDDITPIDFQKPISKLAACENFETGHSFERDVLLFYGASYVPAIAEETYNAELIATYSTEEYASAVVEQSEYEQKIRQGICSGIKSCSSAPGVGGFATGGRYLCEGKCDGLGGCTFADNCICSSACSATLISPECDGLLPPQGLGTCSKTIDSTTGDPLMPWYQDGCTMQCNVGKIIETFKCDDPLSGSDCIYCDPICDGKYSNDLVLSCSAGESFFADQCSSNGQVVDSSDYRCRDSSFHESCTGHELCNNFLVGDLLDNPYIYSDGSISNFAAQCDDSCGLTIADPPLCRLGSGDYANSVHSLCNGRYPGTPVGCSLYGESFIADTCDDSCGIVEDPLGRCSAGPGCTASTQCHNRLPNVAWDNDSDSAKSGTESYCDANCGYKTCLAYNFNSVDGACFDYNDFSDNSLGSSIEEKAAIICNNPTNYQDLGFFIRCLN